MTDPSKKQETKHDPGRSATRIAVAVVRQGDCVLIGPRQAGQVLAGYWEFPGGKVRPGESIAAAAERECREEAGLEIEAGELSVQREHSYPHGRLDLYFLSCRLRHPDQTPRPPFRWIPLGDLSRYSFPPANDQVLKLLSTSSPQ